ncbi:hypothetical protein C4564_01630 [Candidatus Microgenomates bacterium]|nr:MAG: hypothetical protein C4564_01630 [Candidatus Microgenomates bacterium]
MLSSGTVFASSLLDRAADTVPGPKQNQPQELAALTEQSTQILFKTTGVFPFDFFPDELIIDKTKVSILQRNFFWSELIKSVLIKDVYSVTIETGPLFAHLVISDNSTPATLQSDEMQFNTLMIRYLKRSEAFRARCILQGMKIAVEQNVDFDAYSTQELLEQVESLGLAKGDR